MDQLHIFFLVLNFFWIEESINIIVISIYWSQLFVCFKEQMLKIDEICSFNLLLFLLL